MAHSYIETHDTELDAFRAFATHYPDSTLLVDTYSTIEGVRNVIRLAQDPDFPVRAVRLDSGDLATLAAATRELLDDAGLGHIEIFASGDLDEYRIAELVRGGAPIDGFGVGTRMGVSADHPSLDTAYKLVEYAGRSRMKFSTDKSNLPGRKQVYRTDSHDVIALHDESVDGRPLLEKVMAGGKRLPPGTRTLEQIAEYTRRERTALPSLPRRVDFSPGLAGEIDLLRQLS